MAGQIVIITGTSGSGKSTAAKMLATRSQDFWLLFGIDHFTSMMYPVKFGHHGPKSREGIYAHHAEENDPNSPYRWDFGKYGWAAWNAMHEMVAATSRQGLNIVFDHLMFVDPPILQDCIWRLEGLPVLFVCLKPPYEVLLERVATRKMDKPNPAAEALGDAAGLKAAIERLHKLAPWFYEATYKNDCYDLMIDTAKHNPDEVHALIEQRLAQGPGTAFDQLRKRYPRPAK